MDPGARLVDLDVLEVLARQRGEPVTARLWDPMSGDDHERCRHGSLLRQTGSSNLDGRTHD
jgi:hypothetical protein